jgi:hypothetical protein
MTDKYFGITLTAPEVWPRLPNECEPNDGNPMETPR